MFLRLLPYLGVLTLVIGCNSPTPYKRLVGFVDAGSNDSLLIVKPKDDLSKELFFRIDESTKVNRAELIEGNIVEVEYMAPSTSVKYNASVVTTNTTYPKLIGRWVSRDRQGIKVDIELCPNGEIKQYAPKSILLFERWQLASQEEIIEITGTLSIPSEKISQTDDTSLTPSEIKRRRKVERELRSFRTMVALEMEDDAPVLVFYNNIEGDARLYKKE